MQINILDAKNRLSQLIKATQAGEEVIIANRGQPVARLLPVETLSAGKRQPGSSAAILDWLDHYPLPAYARRSPEEIDNDIQQERDAWE